MAWKLNKGRFLESLANTRRFQVASRRRGHTVPEVGLQPGEARHSSGWANRWSAGPVRAFTEEAVRPAIRDVCEP